MEGLIIVLVLLLLLLFGEKLILAFGLLLLFFMETRTNNYRVKGGNEVLDLIRGGKTIPPLEEKGHRLRPDYKSRIDEYAYDAIVNRKYPELKHYRDETCTPLRRVLSSDFPRLKYHRRNNELKLTLHWGQLKLMLTEVEFLTLVLKENPVLPIYMVYAGAAPGNHILYLSELFPTVHFELYDPNEFQIQDTDMIKTHVQFFRDEDAKQWNVTDKYVVFVSDIRTEPATEEMVMRDMEMQKGWYQMMNPELSMFKFRLPWSPGTTQYLDGEIYIQPFPGPTSTETRLIVRKNAQIVDYDNTKYEEQLFHHNTIERNQCHEHVLGNVNIETDGIDNCYDCAAFIHIISEYINTTGSNKTVADMVVELQREIMNGKYTIKSRTIESIDTYLKLVRKEIYYPCRDKNCSICGNAKKEIGRLRFKGKHSKATVDNFEKTNILHI